MTSTEFSAVEEASEPVGRRGVLTGLLGAGAVAGGAALTAFGAAAPAAADPAQPRGRFVEKAMMPVNVRDYGAAGDGETDDSAAIQAAITAAEEAGTSVFFPAGTYLVSEPWRAEGPVTLRGEGMWHTTIAVAASTGFIDAGTHAGVLVVEDIAFDNLGNKQVPLQIDGSFVHEFAFRRCRFTNLRSEGLGPDNADRNGYPAVQLLSVGTGEFVDCLWHNPAAYAGEGTAVRVERPPEGHGGNRLRFTGSNRILWTNNGIRVQARRQQDGAAGEHPPSMLKSLEIDGAYLDGFWYLMPASHSGEGSAVTYSETQLRHAGADFSAVPAAARPRVAIVRAMPLRRSGTVTSAAVTTLTDESADFVEAGVRRMDIVRCSGRWAVVAAEAWSEANPDVVQVEEWFDDETLLPTTPPEPGEDYTIYGIIYGECEAAEGDTLTMSEGARSWHDLYGHPVVPEDGTRYEVLRIRHTYLLTGGSGGIRDLRLVNSVLRRGWADMAGTRPQSSQIIGNLFEDGQEHGIALTGGHAGHQVIGNEFRHMGGFAVWVNQREAALIGNRAEGGRWKRGPLGNASDADFVIVNGQRCQVAHNISVAGPESQATEGIACVTIRHQDNLDGPTQDEESTGNILMYNRRYGHSPDEPDVILATVSGAAPESIHDNEIVGSRRVYLNEGIPGQHVEFRGEGSPEGAVAASPGSTFQRTDGGAGETFYVKESGTGTDGWMAVGGGGGTTPEPAGVTVVKQDATTRRNDDEVTDDPELTLPVEAGALYRVEAFLVYRSSTAADITVGWSAPEGSDLRWSLDGPAVSTERGADTTVNRLAPTLSRTQNAGGSDRTDVCATPVGTLSVGDTAGDLTLQWAQRAAEDSDTVVRRRSYLRLVRIA